jgi:hypothetical protein
MAIAVRSDITSRSNSLRTANNLKAILTTAEVLQYERHPQAAQPVDAGQARFGRGFLGRWG